MEYYLTYDIYLEYICQDHSMTRGEKRQLLAHHQESGRMDVEWVFGVLQSRFVCGPTSPHILIFCSYLILLQLKILI